MKSTYQVQPYLIYLTCTLILSTPFVGEAAEQTVTTRYQSDDQSMWGTGEEKDIKINEDLVERLNINADVAGLELEFNLSAGVIFDLELSSGSIDTTLDYTNGIAYNFADFTVGKWVNIDLINQFNRGVVITEFPDVVLRADLVFNVLASLDDETLLQFDLAGTPLNLLTDNPQRLIGINADGSGKFEILPLLQAVSAAKGAGLQAAVNAAELRAKVREDTNRDPDSLTEGEKREEDKEKKQELAIRFLGAVADAVTASARLPDIATVGIAVCSDPADRSCETNITSAGSDEFVELTFDIDAFLSSLKVIPPLEFDISLGIASINVEILDIDLTGAFGITQNFDLSQSINQRVQFSQTVLVRVDGKAPESVSAGQFIDVKSSRIAILWSESLASSGLDITLGAGHFDANNQWVDAPLVNLKNRTALTGSLAFEVSGLFFDFNPGPSFGPFISDSNGDPIRLELLSGELTPLVTGFNCVSNCAPSFTIDVSPLLALSKGVFSWSSAELWDNGIVGGTGSNVGRAVEISQRNPRNFIKVDGNFEIGNYIGASDLNIFGSLKQSKGDAVTTFNNSSVIYVLSEGSLELHAPITGGSIGTNRVVLAGGTLSGDIDIQSHNVTGSGTINSDTLNIRASSTLQSSNLSCFSNDPRDATGQALCLQDGALTINHSGEQSVMEGTIRTANTPSSIVFNSSSGELNFTARADHRGRIIALNKSNSIQFNAENTILKNQDLSGDGKISFSGTLTSENIILDAAEVVAGNLRILDKLTINSMLTIENNIQTVSDVSLDDQTLVNFGVLNLQGTSNTVLTNILNDGSVVIAGAGAGESATINMLNQSSLVNRGEIQIGDTESGAIGNLVFQPGSTIDFRNTGSKITINNGSTLVFEEPLKQFNPIPGDITLDNLDLTLQGSGTIIFDGKSFAEEVIGLKDNASLTLIESSVIRGERFFIETTSLIILDNSTLSASRIDLTSTPSAEIDSEFGLPLLDVATIRGNGTLRATSSGILNLGLILAEGGELVVDGEIKKATGTNGFLGATTDGILKLNSTNIFGPSKDIDGNLVTLDFVVHNLLVQGNGQIVMDTAIQKITNDAHIAIINASSQSAIIYDECSSCTADQLTDGGFLKGISEIGRVNDFFGGTLTLDSLTDGSVLLGDITIGNVSELNLLTRNSAMLVSAGKLTLSGETSKLHMTQVGDNTLRLVFDSLDILNNDRRNEIYGSGILQGKTIDAAVSNTGLIEAFGGTLTLDRMFITQSDSAALSSKTGTLSLTTVSVTGGIVGVAKQALFTTGRATHFDSLSVFNSGLFKVAGPESENSGLSNNNTFKDVSIFNAGELQFTDISSVLSDSSIVNEVATETLPNGDRVEIVGNGLITVGATGRSTSVNVKIENTTISEGSLNIIDGSLNGYGSITSVDIKVGGDGELKALTDSAEQSLVITGNTLSNFGNVISEGPGSLQLTDLSVQGGGRISALDSSRVNFKNVVLKDSVLAGAGTHENLVDSTLTTQGSVTLENTTLNNTGILKNMGTFTVTADAMFNSVGTWIQDAGINIVNGIASFTSFQVNGGIVAGSGDYQGNITLENGARLMPGLDAKGGTTGDGILSIVGDLVVRAGASLEILFESASSFTSMVVSGAFNLAGYVIFDVLGSSVEALTSGLSIGDFFKSGSAGNPQSLTASDFEDIILVAKTAEGNVALTLEGDLIKSSGVVDNIAPTVSGGSLSYSIDSTGYLTSPSATDVEAVDNLDGVLSPMIFDLATEAFVQGYRPGQHSFSWGAIDKSGNVGTDGVVRALTIKPLILIPARQFASEGNTIRIPIRLNGTSASYPVQVNYSISGTSDSSDHNLLAGVLTINEGVEGEIAAIITQDANEEDIETLIVSLDSSEQVAIGRKNQHTVVIKEGNLAPRVNLLVQQNNVKTRIVTKSGGLVVVTAVGTDPNGDNLSYDFSMSDSRLAGTINDNTLTFDPSTLETNTYRSSVIVIDDGPSALSVEKSLLLKVVETMPMITAGQDSDGDGINDEVEGSQDLDEDGIPDFLDPFTESFLLKADSLFAATQFMQSEPGSRLVLGESAFSIGSSDATIDLATLRANSTDASMVDDASFEYPLGVYDFIIDQLPTAGMSTNVVLPTIAAIPSNAIMRKFNLDTGWQSFVIDNNNKVSSAPGEFGICPEPGSDSYENGLIATYTCIQLTLQDGGPNDLDGIENGSIVDPSAVATNTLDTDGDQIPDSFELANGLNKDDEADALLDADGDNLSNLNEFLGGTDPQNANDPDTIAPQITILGTNPVTITQSANYIDAGATALDLVDNNLTDTITTISTVDVAVIGQYTVTYTVSDNQNNVSSSIRVVNVIGADSDSDGISDDFELIHGLNPDSSEDASEDPDNDGLTNLEEFLLGSDPLVSNIITPDRSRLKNIATRGQVGTGEKVLIAGFVISGFEPVSVIIRARGPALTELGINGALANPQLTLFSGSTVIDSNNDWQSHPNINLIPGNLRPSDDREAVIAITLSPGAYTAIVSGEGGSEGIGLVEVFERDDSGETRLVNIATRGFVGTGDDVLIGGFVITGTQKKKILLNAKGPSLADAGVNDVLADPEIFLFSGATIIAQNNNWQDQANANEIPESLRPSNSLEASILIELEPGAYTAIVAGVGQGTGISLIEAFEIE